MTWESLWECHEQPLISYSISRRLVIPRSMHEQTRSTRADPFFESVTLTNRIIQTPQGLAKIMFPDASGRIVVLNRDASQTDGIPLREFSSAPSPESSSAFYVHNTYVHHERTMNARFPHIFPSRDQSLSSEVLFGLSLSLLFCFRRTVPISQGLLLTEMDWTKPKTEGIHGIRVHISLQVNSVACNRYTPVKLHMWYESSLPSSVLEHRGTNKPNECQWTEIATDSLTLASRDTRIRLIGHVHATATVKGAATRGEKRLFVGLRMGALLCLSE